ncbi:MAG: LD-carboxypeptidase [Nitrospinales bacterium]
MNRPNALKKGDRVGVVAPAGVVSPDALKKGLNAIERLGFRVTLGRHVLSRHRFMAGTDRERADDLMAMFADPEIKAIVCARGGYGVNRVLPLLKPKLIRDNPKIVVGSSDITLLLIYLNRNCSLVAFHGPMAAGSFGRRPMPQSEKQFRQALTGSAGGKRLRSAQARVLRDGRARGTLAGGNLTLMCRSLKTRYEIRTAGSILLIEDVNEKPYRIDGMLWQLRKAGKFKDVRGIVFGEMINCRPAKNDSYCLDDVIADCFKDDSFPILANCPIAHGKEMWTLPLGVEATLDTQSKSLTLKDCGVV